MQPWFTYIQKKAEGDLDVSSPNFQFDPNTGKSSADEIPTLDTKPIGAIPPPAPKFFGSLWDWAKTNKGAAFAPALVMALLGAGFSGQGRRTLGALGGAGLGALSSAIYAYQKNPQFKQAVQNMFTSVKDKFSNLGKTR